MQKSRFIVVSVPRPDATGEPIGEDITWILVSSNNRPLGRGGTKYSTSEDCREAVVRLRQQHGRATTSAVIGEPAGQWSWRVDVDGATVAVSTRTYLRQRECDYNLQRFLEAVPSAELVDTVRNVRSGRRR